MFSIEFLPCIVYRPMQQQEYVHVQSGQLFLNAFNPKLIESIIVEVTNTERCLTYGYHTD